MDDVPSTTIDRRFGSGELAEASFGPDPESAGEVRRFVEISCARWDVARNVVDVAVLLSSELAANVIQHVRTPFVVRIARTASTLEVAAVDGSVDLPTRFPPSVERVGGRGIYLLDQLATRWGFERTPIGKTMWFSLMLIPQPAEPDPHL